VYKLGGEKLPQGAEEGLGLEGLPISIALSFGGVVVTRFFVFLNWVGVIIKQGGGGEDHLQ